MTAGERGQRSTTSTTAPSLPQIFPSFLRLGAVSLGGPGMAVYIKRLAVVRKHWLLEDDFQQGVALCQAMPGATAMQCSAYVGLRTRRLGGAAAAYLGFGLPAFALMLVRPIAYQQAVGVPAVVTTMTGLRALVVALVANAAWTFGRSSISNIREGLISGFAAALLLRKVDVVWVVLVGGVVSALVI